MTNAMNTDALAAENDLLAIEVAILNEMLDEIRALPGLRAELRRADAALRTARWDARPGLARTCSALQSHIQTIEDFIAGGAL